MEILKITLTKEEDTILGKVETDGNIGDIIEGSGDIIAELVRVLANDSNGSLTKTDVFRKLINKTRNSLIDN